MHRLRVKGNCLATMAYVLDDIDTPTIGVVPFVWNGVPLRWHTKLLHKTIEQQC